MVEEVSAPLGLLEATNGSATPIVTPKSAHATHDRVQESLIAPTLALEDERGPRAESKPMTGAQPQADWKELSATRHEPGGELKPATGSFQSA